MSSNDIKIYGTEHFINISDGQTVRVIKTGQGKPLVLMHTIRTQIEYVHQIISTLAQNYTVYAL